MSDTETREKSRLPDAERVDAIDKVRGATRYAADRRLPQMAYAMLAVATIARGRIVAMDIAKAQAVKGVQLVLTHENIGPLKGPGFLLGGGFGFQSLQPLATDQIAYRGQAIALVVADTLEAAIEAAALVRARYETQAASVGLDAPGTVVLAQADSPLPKPAFNDKRLGDAPAAYAAAPHRIEARFNGPAQHVNPIELLATVAEWNGDALTIHESTQNTGAIRGALAAQLGIDAQQIRVLSPSIGGGFGQKNSMQGHTVLVAMAARKLQRPVKLVLARNQVFHGASFRPASRHTVRLSADSEGRLQSLQHEVDQMTSRHDLFPSMCTEVSASAYKIPNISGRERLVRCDIQTPGFMRGPWEHFAMFALESSLDELAQQLGMDPVALRLANDTMTEPISGKPFSSRHLAECLRRGAAQFGWEKRSATPGSMKAENGDLIGYGMAAGAYKAAIAPAVAKLLVTDTGRIEISVAGHEMGQGIRNAVASVVAKGLGVRPRDVTVLIGDTQAAPQHLTAGSWGTATAVPACEAAVVELKKALAALGDVPGARTPQQVLRAAGQSQLQVEARHRAPGQPEQIHARVAQGLPSAAGPHYPEFAAFSYAAHFVEVRIERSTRRVRVHRVVSVMDCGRVVSPRTARSQVLGGVVWGIGAALREASEVDPRFGGFVNADLAEYVVPVNADIGQIEVDFIDQPDTRLNASGVKGLGEVVMVGVAPAIANAVFHATGRRVRDLPIRYEHLL